MLTISCGTNAGNPERAWWVHFALLGSQSGCFSLVFCCRFLSYLVCLSVSRSVSQSVSLSVSESVVSQWVNQSVSLLVCLFLCLFRRSVSFEVNEGLFLFSSSDDDIDESLVSWFNHVLCNIHNTTTTATSLQPPFFLAYSPYIHSCFNFSTMATSLQQPFFWRTVHTFTLVSTSLQWPLSSVPNFAVVERLNCILFDLFCFYVRHKLC